MEFDEQPKRKGKFYATWDRIGKEMESLITSIQTLHLIHIQSWDKLYFQASFYSYKKLLISFQITQGALFQFGLVQ